MNRRETLRKALPDIVAGSIFIAFGLVFAVQSLGYELGTLFRMGAGFFPLVLGVVLAGLGVLVVASGFVAEREEPAKGFPWRGIVLIPLAFILFGLTVRGLGVAPALFIATLFGGLASSRINVLMAFVIAGGLTVMAVIIFIVLLQLRLPLFGPWLRF